MCCAGLVCVGQGSGHGLFMMAERRPEPTQGTPTDTSTHRHPSPTPPFLLHHPFVSVSSPPSAPLLFCTAAVSLVSRERLDGDWSVERVEVAPDWSSSGSSEHDHTLEPEDDRDTAKLLRGSVTV